MKYKDYKAKIYDKETFEEQISLTREEYKITTKHADFSELYTDFWIPFNLEREYFDFLIENRNYSKAREVLTRMRNSYTDFQCQNFIESYEYRLNNIMHANDTVRVEIIEAKKEFNSHTILIISVVVGIITIFGAANVTINSTCYRAAVFNFVAIVFAIIFLTFTAFFANSLFRK